MADLGRLAYEFSAAEGSTVLPGMDIARVRDGVIVELYTFVDGIN